MAETDRDPERLAEAGAQPLHDASGQPFPLSRATFREHLGLRVEQARDGLRDIFEAEMEARRGFLFLPVLFGIGILGYFALPAEPFAPALIVTAIAPAALAVLQRAHIGRLRLFLALAAVAAGLATAKLRTDHVSAPILAREQVVSIRGWIEGRERTDTGVRLKLRLAEARGIPSQRMPHTVRIVVRRGEALKVGDGIEVLARLSPPSGPVLPGGFDFARSAFYERIGAVGFAYGAARPAELGPPPFDIRLRQPLADIRQTIGTRVAAALPGEIGSIAVALIVGERGPIPDEADEALRDSGLAHILSISGLHMVLVAGAAFAALRALLALSSGLALHRPIKKWAAAGALLVSTVYLGLSGAGVATQRAYVMLAIMLVAVMLDRRAITLRNVALSALIVLALAPESVLSASFQMSFAAVLALVSAYEALAARRDRDAPLGNGKAGAVVRWLRDQAGGLALSSLVAGLATAPFAAFHFQRTAPLSLLANLAALPAVSVLVMPMALAAVFLMPFGLESLPLRLMELGLEWVLIVARTVAGWSAWVGLVGLTDLSALLLIVAGFVWLALWSRLWRFAGLIPIAFGILAAFGTARPDVIVSASGEGAVARGADGRFVVLGKPSNFEIEQWLRSDADPRSDEPRKVARGSCDNVGCAVRLRDRRFVALALKPDAFEDDCRIAGVILSALAVPKGCGPGAIVIDQARLRVGGAHAIYFNNGKDPRVETSYPAVRRAFMPPVPDVNSGG